MLFNLFGSGGPRSRMSPFSLLVASGHVVCSRNVFNGRRLHLAIGKTSPDNDANAVYFRPAAATNRKLSEAAMLEDTRSPRDSLQADLSPLSDMNRRPHTRVKLSDSRLRWYVHPTRHPQIIFTERPTLASRPTPN